LRSSPRGAPRDSKSAFTRVCDALCVRGDPVAGTQGPHIGSRGPRSPPAHEVVDSRWSSPPRKRGRDERGTAASNRPPEPCFTYLRLYHTSPGVGSIVSGVLFTMNGATPTCRRQMRGHLRRSCRILLRSSGLRSPPAASMLTSSPRSLA